MDIDERFGKQRKASTLLLTSLVVIFATTTVILLLIIIIQIFNNSKVSTSATPISNVSTKIYNSNLLTAIQSTGQDDYLIAVVNESSLVSDDEVKQTMAAQQKQINNEFFQIWGVSALLQFFSSTETGNIPSNVFQMIILDNTNQANALGYHTITSTGLPLAKVFVEDAIQDGVPWSLPFSHETLEMIMDPFAALDVFLQSSNTSGVIVSFEICDPVEGPTSAYTIDGIMVSDFILPSWFEFYNTTNTYFDYTQQLDQPVSVLPGGYAMVFPVPNNNQGWVNIGGNSNSVVPIMSFSNKSFSILNDWKKIKTCKRLEERHKKVLNHKGKKFIKECFSKKI